MNDERFCTIREVAREDWAPNEHTIRLLVKSGKVPGFHVGGGERKRFYIDAPEFKKMLDGMCKRD